MPLVTTGAAVPGLYSHITHSIDKDEAEIPHLLRVQNQSKPEVEENLKENLKVTQNPPKDQEADKSCTYDNTNNYYHNDNYTVPGQSQGRRPNGQSGSQRFQGFTQ